MRSIFFMVVRINAEITDHRYYSACTVIFARIQYASVLARICFTEEAKTKTGVISEKNGRDRFLFI